MKTTSATHPNRRLALIPALLLAWLAMLGSARADLTTGLVGWWKLNETSGTTALDSSGSGNHGTRSANMTSVPGAPVGETALFFNGAERVSVSDSPSLNMTAGISICAWVKAESWNSPSVILSKGTGVAYQYLLQAYAGNLMFNLNGGFPAPIELTTPLPSTGAWHHVAGTFDGSQIALYLDGTVVTQRVATGSIAISANQLNIGAILGPPNPYGFFTGAIGDVRIYNRALNPSEIGELAGTPAEPCVASPSGQVAWWPGDGNATDIRGTNNGTLIGTAFAPGIVGQAFRFNGGNYVQIQGDGVLSATNISVAGWFNVAQQNNGPALAGKTSAFDGWSLLIGDGLRPDFTLYRTGILVAVLSAVPITLNTWAHIAATYDGTTACIFVNGALQGAEAFPGGYTHSSVPMLIGAASWCESYGCGGYNFRLNGLVDELSIYDRALTASEIQAMYAADSSGMCKAPVISVQPSSQTVVTNSTATFTVSAMGLSPLFYQWRFDGSNLLSGETNSYLLLTNISLSQAGAYSVLVSNQLGSVVSSNAILTVYVAGVDYDADGLLNETEIQLGTNPYAPDTDGDGLSDYAELFVHGTSPLTTDTDGDGIPDGWEVQHGLNPRFNDASDDLDGDGLSNLAEYQWSQSHANTLDPRTPYSTSPALSDYALATGNRTNWFLYDRNDRLIGAQYDNGLGLAYLYDGNDNLVRQKAMLYDANTNGLPDVWEFLNGLTNSASAFTDTDGDGWTDSQEWKAGTSPTNALSTPNLLGNPGINTASLTLPFTPSNFVVGVGQLDGVGAEEIVLGADGNPGANTNFLLVLTQGATTWQTQRVDVGSFGITSVAVGQPTNRPVAGIYVGLRGTTNGSGRVMEYARAGGVWQSNVVALSTNQAAFVLGVRGPDVLVSLATTNAPDGSLSVVNFVTNWSVSVLDTNTSRRGLGSTMESTREIAYDAIGSGFIASGTLLTTPHTCMGVDRILLAFVVGAQAPPGDVITGVTYNGIPMTKIHTLGPGVGSDRYRYAFFLTNPPIGSHDVVVSASSSTFIHVDTVSYTGAKQSGQPSAQGTSVAASGTSFAPSLTTLDDNSWLVGWLSTEASTALAGLGVTLRSPSGNPQVFDSGGSVGSAGVHALNYTSAGNTTWGSLMVAISPTRNTQPLAPLRLLDSGGIQIGDCDSISSTLNQGLIALYPLDGDANDVSGKGNHGTNTGVTWVSGVRAGAAEFNGANAFIEASAFPDSSSFSFAAWLFVPSVDSTAVIFMEGDTPAGYVELEVNPADNLRIYVKGVAGTIDYSAIPMGRWFHCAGVGDAQINRLQLWINGAKVAEKPFSGQANVGCHSRLQIGRSMHSGIPQLYFKGKVDDLRFYGRVLSSQEIADLASTAGPTLPEPLPEPSATGTNNWRGSSLASGSLRGKNGTSIFYTFADDKNANGLIDFADDFVTAEYLMTGTNASLLTTNRQPIAALTPAQSYGLASVNFLNASNEVFFTGEPDGEMFAWTATGATNPLQRQLFSGHHAGKAWHALAGVKTLQPGEGLIGLRVDPTNQNTCDLLFWSPQLRLPQVVSLPNTAPAAAVLLTTNILGAQASVTVRLWDAEGNASTPYLQYQLGSSANWQDAAIATLDDTAYSARTRVTASPGGSNHTLVWNALANVGAGVVTNVSLRARASDMTLLGDWSAPTPFQLNTALADHDGLPDWWELQFFGTTARDGSADFDGDGFSDLAEYIADTNPTNAVSRLEITGMSFIPGGLKIDWQGGSSATQQLQRSVGVDAMHDWSNIFTALPPTPISGSYTDSVSTNVMQFYRIRATR